MGRKADPEVLRQSKGRSMGGTMEEERGGGPWWAGSGGPRGRSARVGSAIVVSG